MFYICILIILYFVLYLNWTGDELVSYQLAGLCSAGGSGRHDFVSQFHCIHLESISLVAVLCADTDVCNLKRYLIKIPKNKIIAIIFAFVFNILICFCI